MDSPRWVWQEPDWPQFHWQADALASLLRACLQAQGRLLGMTGAIGGDAQAQGELDTLLQNIITSSAIEGETINAASVRSSLARRLGVAADEEARITPRNESLAELMLDATQRCDAPLQVSSAGMACMAVSAAGRTLLAPRSRRQSAWRRSDAVGFRAHRPPHRSFSSSK